MTSLAKKAFLGAAIGTMIEYYDYALFSIFLPLIAPSFFPAASAYQSLIKGYVVFLIAALARPVGGILFGRLGDLYGRPRALLASMYGIAWCTLLMGVIPSYAAIGFWAVVLIVAAKTIQIACFGGEYNGAGIYVVEHAQRHREALTGSLLTAAMLSGSLAASLLGIFLTLPAIPAWSWRIAFILGGLVGFVGIAWRKNLSPPPHFLPADSQKHRFSHLLKEFPRELLAGVFIGAMATAPFSTVILFVMPVLASKGMIDHHQMMWLESILILFAVISLVPIGLIGDKCSPVKTMKASCLMLVGLAWPLLSVVDQGKLYWMMPAMIGIIVINEIFLGPSNAYLKNIFPMQYRYRGSSFSFCIGLSLAGGLTPLIENVLYQWTGHFCAAAIWLVLMGAGTFLSLVQVGKKDEIILYSSV